jgi:predicted O-methyltransferase YrrM
MAYAQRSAALHSAQENDMALHAPSPLSKPGKYENFFTPAMRDYVVQVFGGDDEHLRALARDADAAGYPAIAISPFDGLVLQWLVRLVGAKRAVEIGTLGGYSTLWIARALPAGGRLDSFELDPERADFARRHVAAAAPPADVHVHAGPALENLSRVPGPVDFVFIDADKANYPNYLAWSAANLRAGGLVALDNAFAWGGLADPSVLGDRSGDALAMRAVVDAIAHDPRWRGTMIPTNEGLAVAVRE